MAEPYLVWALLVGVAIGGAVVWFVVGRLPRRSDDIGPEERSVEAAWISDVIATQGGNAPSLLVEQVLELHEQYLAGPPIEITSEDQARLRQALDNRRLAQAEAEAAARAAAAKAAAAAEPESAEDPEQTSANAPDAGEVSETRP